MTYTEAEEYLFSIPRFTTKNEPGKTRAFLEELSDFSSIIPTVHVAGTNGKGSVCAYLRSALNANGLRVGMFTSPHLVCTRERFAIDSEMISEREFVNVFSLVMEALGEFRKQPGYSDYHPTFFEYLFFMAAVWFGEKKPDVVVLETGLGGRLDATNSVKSPKVCVITEIGLDHCEYLGNTKELIAAEKAGIIKPGIPVVYTDRGEAWSNVIKSRAVETGSESFAVSRENIKNLETSGAGIDFSMQSLYDSFVKISLNTGALYQIENSALAYRTLEVLSDFLPASLDMNKCLEGFEHMMWPGRMEKLPSGLVIDGAHNEDGIRAFLETVAKDGLTSRCLLFGAVSDKNVEAVASMIIESRLFKKIFVTRLSSYRSCDFERLKRAFGGANECDVSYYDCSREALNDILKFKGEGVGLYAAGSLYLVGEIKAGEENCDD